MRNPSSHSHSYPSSVSTQIWWQLAIPSVHSFIGSHLKPSPMNPRGHWHRWPLKVSRQVADSLAELGFVQHPWSSPAHSLVCIVSARHSPGSEFSWKPAHRALRTELLSSLPLYWSPLTMMEGKYETRPRPALNISRSILLSLSSTGCAASSSGSPTQASTSRTNDWDPPPTSMPSITRLAHFPSKALSSILHSLANPAA